MQVHGFARLHHLTRHIMADDCGNFYRSGEQLIEINTGIKTHVL